MSRLCTLIAALVATLFSAAAGAAVVHPPLPTVALVKMTAGGDVEVTIIHDALAFALNDTSVNVGDAAMYALMDGGPEGIAAAFEDGVARLKVGLRLSADGAPLAFSVAEHPTPESLRQWVAEHRDRRLPCKMDFVVRCKLPAGARTMTCRFPEVFAEVLLVTDRPGLEPSDVLLAPAEVSPGLDVSMATGSPAGDGADQASGHRPEVGMLGLFWRYVSYGFRHIIPQGLDHCFFVLGLFLLSPRWKPVLLQITTFTIAHTVTLTLTSLHVIGLPAGFIEPAIALSVAFIGIENLATTKVHPWRPAIAFFFGLVHGMGVATAFNEAPFPPGHLVPSLAAFTVGVEAGHVAILAAAFLALGWFRDKPWYRARIAIPLSVVIAAVALVWTVQRLWPGAGA